MSSTKDLQDLGEGWEYGSLPHGKVNISQLLLLHREGKMRNCHLQGLAKPKLVASLVAPWSLETRTFG